MHLTNIVPSAIYTYNYKFGRYWEEAMEYPDGPDERFGEETNDIYKLNWLSIEDIVENEELLTENQAAGLKFILNPYYHADKNSNKYITNTILQAMANSPHFVSYCHCGTVLNPELAKKREKEEGKKTIKACNRSKFCDRCCTPLRYELMKRIADYYRPDTKENLWFLTITDDNNRFNFTDTGYDQIFNAWKKQQMYIDVLANNGYISGAFKTEELSVTSLFPTTQVNPHTHLICRSELPLGDHKCHGLKIKATQITSEKEWTTKLAYLRKPIDVAKTYIHEWTSDKSTVINRNVKNFLHGYGVVFRDHKSFVASGVFHANNKDNVLHSEAEYFAKRPDQNKNYKKKLKAKKARDKKRAEADPLFAKKLRAKEREKAKSKTLKEKAPKKACKKPKKKIECKEPAMYEEFEKGVLDTLKVATLPEETVSLLKEAYEAYGIPGQEFAPPVEEQKPKSSFMGTLGKGLALGGLAAGGAYLYGKHGNGGANPLSNFTKTVDTGLAGAYEKGSPYLSKAIDKAPLLSDNFRNQAKGYLAPSADQYAEGIKNYTLEQGFAGQLQHAQGMTPIQLKGTNLDGIGDDAMQKVLRGGENVAAPIFMGALASKTPGMAASGLSGLSNLASKANFTSPLVRPLAGAAGGINAARTATGGVLSKIPGASKVMSGGAKFLGPAAAIFGAADAMDLGQRAFESAAKRPNSFLESFDPRTMQQGIKQNGLFGEAWNRSSDSVLGNPFINPASMFPKAMGAVQQSSMAPQWVKDVAGSANKYMGKATGLATHGVGSYFTGGWAGLAAPLINSGFTKSTQAGLDAAGNSGASKALTDTFQEAVRMKDQGYSNPLQGWYAAQPKEQLKAYIASLSDKELAAKIEAMNPSR